MHVDEGMSVELLDASVLDRMLEGLIEIEEVEGDVGPIAPGTECSETERESEEMILTEDVGDGENEQESNDASKENPESGIFLFSHSKQKTNNTGADEQRRRPMGKNWSKEKWLRFFRQQIPEEEE